MKSFHFHKVYGSKLLKGYCTHDSRKFDNSPTSTVYQSNCVILIILKLVILTSKCLPSEKFIVQTAKLFVVANTHFISDSTYTAWKVFSGLHFPISDWIRRFTGKSPYSVRSLSFSNHEKCRGILNRLLLKFFCYVEWFDQRLHEKWSFALRISSVNVTKFAGNCGFGHITEKILESISFFCSERRNRRPCKRGCKED